LARFGFSKRDADATCLSNSLNWVRFCWIKGSKSIKYKTVKAPLRLSPFQIQAQKATWISLY
jgi:hypothetical protein